MEIEHIKKEKYDMIQLSLCLLGENLMIPITLY